MSRPRVLLLAQRTPDPEAGVAPSGSGAHVAATLAALRRSCEVLPLFGDGGGSGAAAAVRRLRRVVPARVRGLRQDALLLRADRAFRARALAAAADFRPDLVYERSEYLSLAGARLSRALDVPLVLEVNGLLDRDVRTMYRSPAEPLGTLVERAKHRRATAVVTVSPGLADLLAARGAAPERTVVVPNTVDPARVRAEPLPARSGPVTIGWVGHLMQWHVEAIELLVEVAPDVRRRAPGTRFLVVGGGPGLAGLRRRVEASGLGDAFEFTGTVPYADVPGRLERADVGVIPAVFDYAFPVKLVEMGALGLPVVAPRSGSLDRMLAPHVEYEPFEPGRGEALATALATLAASPDRRRALGGALHHAVRERYTWDAAAKTLGRLVHDLVPGSQAAGAGAPGRAGYARPDDGALAE